MRECFNYVDIVMRTLTEIIKVRLPEYLSLISTCKGTSDAASSICNLHLSLYPFPHSNTRADRLHRLAWESGKVLPEHIKEKLSPSEVSYYQQYQEALDEYSKSIHEGLRLDLTVDLTPPK